MKLSVLSPVFNEERYVNQMMDSVLSQSGVLVELIFVDDGSTDRTTELIAARCATDSRVKIVSQSRRLGKVSAFNEAFAASNGDLVTLMGGDDIMPDGSLAARQAPFHDVDCSTSMVVAFFKIRTFSTERRYDGKILPRGARASRSGGSVTMTRRLAAEVFPIPTELAAEDPWVSYACEGLADQILERHDVVLDYRIHAGNSNPRQKSFEEMRFAMAKRHEAWQRLLDCDRFELSPEARERLNALSVAEELRLRGAVLHLMTLNTLSVADRAAFASMASPLLFALRTRYFGLFSGLRGR